MTVGVAAICRFKGYPFIIGASDRMYTVGYGGVGQEYEPQQTKTFPITNHVTVLAAGNTTHQTLVLRRTRAESQRTGATDTAVIAGIYAACASEVRREIAETAVLAPLGLSFDTFTAQQRNLDPELVRRLADELAAPTYDLGIEAIIAGVQPDRATLWQVIETGPPQCVDAMGFCAIGSGAPAAYAELMSHGFTSGDAYHKALYLVYAAKRRAESMTGVGAATDIFLLHYAEDGQRDFPAQGVEVIDRIFRSHVRREKAAYQTSYERLRKELEASDERQRAQAATQATPQADINRTDLPPGSVGASDQGGL